MGGGGGDIFKGGGDPSAQHKPYFTRIRN